MDSGHISGGFPRPLQPGESDPLKAKSQSPDPHIKSPKGERPAVKANVESSRQKVLGSPKEDQGDPPIQPKSKAWDDFTKSFAFEDLKPRSPGGYWHSSSRELPPPSTTIAQRFEDSSLYELDMDELDKLDELEVEKREEDYGKDFTQFVEAEGMERVYRAEIEEQVNLDISEDLRALDFHIDLEIPDDIENQKSEDISNFKFKVDEYFKNSKLIEESQEALEIIRSQRNEFTTRFGAKAVAERENEIRTVMESIKSDQKKIESLLQPYIEEKIQKWDSILGKQTKLLEELNDKYTLLLKNPKNEELRKEIASLSEQIKINETIIERISNSKTFMKFLKDLKKIDREFGLNFSNVLPKKLALVFREAIEKKQEEVEEQAKRLLEKSSFQLFGGQESLYEKALRVLNSVRERFKFPAITPKAESLPSLRKNIEKLSKKFNPKGVDKSQFLKQRKELTVQLAQLENSIAQLKLQQDIAFKEVAFPVESRMTGLSFKDQAQGKYNQLLLCQQELMKALNKATTALWDAGTLTDEDIENNDKDIESEKFNQMRKAQKEEKVRVKETEKSNVELLTTDEVVAKNEKAQAEAVAKKEKASAKSKELDDKFFATIRNFLLGMPVEDIIGKKEQFVQYLSKADILALTEGPKKDNVFFDILKEEYDASKDKLDDSDTKMKLEFLIKYKKAGAKLSK